ncbi:MAG: acyl carrier protein [Burkholderiaceae bacterium]|jgi:acyl carrier protein|nr:acyl carrier protein [Burkholderiales bacterium]MCZ8096992.1 acyl carrier protein [Burkholderiales bacterium]MCZ8338035.1 acyl carrier protein [Burkholderiaceae bacterium]
MDDARTALRAEVLDAILSIAPEVDPAALDDARPLRHQVDLDSMDWLNVMIALDERLGVKVPESDYARLDTLAQLVDYLNARVRRSDG